MAHLRGGGGSVGVRLHGHVQGVEDFRENGQVHHPGPDLHTHRAAHPRADTRRRLLRHRNLD